MTKLRALQKHHPLIGGVVRGLVLMTGKELVKDKKLTPAATEAEAIRDALLNVSSKNSDGYVFVATAMAWRTWPWVDLRALVAC